MTHQVIAFSRPVQTTDDACGAPLSSTAPPPRPVPAGAVSLTVALRYLASRNRFSLPPRPALARPAGVASGD